MQTFGYHIEHAAVRARLMGASAAAQSAECLEKTVETMRLLAQHGDGDERAQHYLLTGATMREHAHRLLGLRCASGGS